MAQPSTERGTSTRTRDETKYPARYNVVIDNDDTTPAEFVIQLLIEIFNKPLDAATGITLDIHTTGNGIAGTYSRELAEQKLAETKIAVAAAGLVLVTRLEAI